jgi:hypothetical protein
MAGLILGLVACSGSGSKERLAQACIKDNSMTEAQCRCVADRAEKDLSKDAMELIVAQAEENTQRVDELSRKISMDDAQKVGTFLMNATTQCMTATNND